MKINFLRFWSKIIFINLLVVATLGVVLRYKIAFYLPFVDQKHLLHAHSHFAFAGWVGQAIMFLLVNYLLQRTGEIKRIYTRLLTLHVISAYGMLLSFPFQGYGAVSISFSVLSILVSYVFAWVFWRDLNTLEYHISHWWFKLALFFSVISSAGTFALSAMMVTRTIHQNWYLAAIYFYLHFQYNGWFFFSSMGLLFSVIGRFLNPGAQKTIFWLFALSCIPAYILSALWLPIPSWTYSLVVIAAIMQFAGWIILLRKVFSSAGPISEVVGFGKVLLLLSALACTIKVSLQLGSTIPFLGTLAFGFRPIVIGYLHLMLLGVISLFIIGYLLAQRLISFGTTLRWGLTIFVGGIIINELLLMVQGIGAMSYVCIPYMNELLLTAALIMFTGIVVVNVSVLKNGTAT